MLACPRGSRVRIFLTKSSFSLIKSLFSAIVRPGILGNPPVITLSGWPAVWVSIVKNVFENFNLMSDLPNTVQINFFSSGLFGSPLMPLSESPIQWIIEQLESKKMPSLVSKIYEFSQIKSAHQDMENNRILGKAVIKV